MAVDTLTGQVEVLKIISVHDVGKAINKQQVEAQIAGALAQAACPAHTEGFSCTEYESPPRHASTPSGRYVMYFYIETCPHCQDARPKVDAWRKTLPQDLKYIEHVAKWRDREGAAFAYRIESVPSFVVNGKYLIAIDSWEPEHTDAAIALVSELAGLEPAD